MSKELNKNQQENVSGGVRQAPNGTFWLNHDEANSLRNLGYHVSYLGNDLPGWEGVEAGTTGRNSINYQVNDPENHRVRDVSVLINALANNNI